MNDANKSVGHEIIKAVCRLKVFQQDHGEEDFTKVADPYHRQLLQQQSRRSSIIGRAHNYIHMREFLFQPDKRILRPILKPGIPAKDCGKSCAASEDYDPRGSTFKVMDLTGKARYQTMIRSAGNGPVNDRIQELINELAYLWRTHYG
jgi:hypothetical protein